MRLLFRLRIIIGVVVLLWVNLIASTAHAYVNVCNKGDVKVWVAGYERSGGVIFPLKWFLKGWTGVVKYAVRAARVPIAMALREL